MSCLGLSPDEFFDLTPRAFQLAMRAHNEQATAKVKAQLEAARLSGFLAAKPAMSVEAQKKIWCPQLMWGFPWDEKVERPVAPAPTETHMAKARKWLMQGK